MFVLSPGFPADWATRRLLSFSPAARPRLPHPPLGLCHPPPGLWPPTPTLATRVRQLRRPTYGSAHEVAPPPRPHAEHDMQTLLQMRVIRVYIAAEPHQTQQINGAMPVSVTSMSRDPEARHTQIATRTLAQRVLLLLDDAPDAIRERFDNALLNVAVNRLVEAEGPSRAAAILWRLADLLGDAHARSAATPVEITRMDA